MTPQIVLIASSARPNTFARTYERLTGVGGVARLYAEGRIAKPWLYYCKRRDQWIPSFVDEAIWDLTIGIRSRPFVTNMFKMIERIELGRDFIFLEDDIAPCTNAVERVVTEDVPPWAGVMTFFDYRCEWTSPGVFPHPVNRDLWGSQALKFPARVIPALKEFVAKETIKVKEGTDAWAGLAAYAQGLTVAGYSPTIFQHLGMLSTYAPGRVPPIAANFPGEDFDAMGACSDPILPGDWVKVTEDMYCPLHRKNHEPKDFGRCGFTRETKNNTTIGSK